MQTTLLPYSPRGSVPWLAIVALMALAATTEGCAASTTARLGLSEPTTAARVDLRRYLGTWYEIASFPKSFQEGCSETQATYELRDDGSVQVLNQCRVDGRIRTSIGRAVVVDEKSNAKLKVSFFWPFWGDYWILAVGDRYEYAVVGEPGRDALWILARDRRLDPAVLSSILADLNARGFDTTRLRTTSHPSSAAAPRE